jgi:hypothetical protein
MLARFVVTKMEQELDSIQRYWDEIENKCKMIIVQITGETPRSHDPPYDLNLPHIACGLTASKIGAITTVHRPLRVTTDELSVQYLLLGRLKPFVGNYWR